MSELKPQPNRGFKLKSFFRFNLRFLLIMFLIVGALFGWLGREIGIINQEQALIEQLIEHAEEFRFQVRHSSISAAYKEQYPDYDDRFAYFDSFEVASGVHVQYDFEFDEFGKFIPLADPRRPNWASRLISFLNGSKSHARPFSRIHSITTGAINERAKIDFSSLHRLRSLSIESINNVDQLDFPPQLQSLTIDREVKLDGSGLSKISRLRRLKKLSLREGGELKNLDGLAGLSNLEELDLESPSLESIGQHAGLKELRELSFYTPSLKSLSGIGDATNLKSLKIIGGNRISLRDLSGLDNLTELETLTVDCSALNSVAPIKELSNLKKLTLRHCDALEDIQIFSNLENLEIILLHGSSWDPLDPSSLSHLVKLKSIEIPKANSIDLAWTSRMNSLISLSINDASQLQSTDGIESLNRLQFFYLDHCDSLEQLSGIDNVHELQTLTLKNAGRLAHVRELKQTQGLTSICLIGVNSLESLDAVNQIPNLEWLTINGCDGLKNLDCLNRLTKLKRLSVGDCNSLENLNGLWGQNSLEFIEFNNCNELSNIDGLHGLHKCLNIVFSKCEKISKEQFDALEQKLQQYTLSHDLED